MNTSTKYSEFHITNREVESRKFYSLVGILLACVAILLALGAEPAKVFRSNDAAISNATMNSPYQAQVADRALTVAKSE